METLHINARLQIPLSEIDLSAIRSQGPGGQNVNKVASAIHLRFDVKASSLPDRVKAKLLAISDSRLTTDGVVVIKAQSSRTQAANKAEALARLKMLIKDAIFEHKPRRATRPTYGSVKRRLKSKTKRGEIKKTRGKVKRED